MLLMSFALQNRKEGNLTCGKMMSTKTPILYRSIQSVYKPHNILLASFGHRCTTLQKLAEIPKKALWTNDPCHSCKLHDDELVA